jgi:hypothetical protein
MKVKPQLLAHVPRYLLKSPAEEASTTCAGLLLELPALPPPPHAESVAAATQRTKVEALDLKDIAVPDNNM